MRTHLLLLPLFFLLPSLTLAKAPPPPYKPGELCGLGKVIAGMKISPDFWHVTQVDVVRRQFAYYESRYGKCSEFKNVGSLYYLKLGKGTVAVALDKEKTGDLLKVEIRAADRFEDSVELAADDFTQLTNTNGIFVAKNGEAVFARNENASFNAARSRYIPLLGLVADAVKGGKLSWEQIVKVDDAKKAPANAFLNQFPAGAAFTVDLLKDFVLFYEDESAADHLVALIDRSALNKLEKKTGSYLTNKEAKSAAGAVAWHLSPKDLCAGLYKIRGDAALLRRNSTIEANHKNFSLYFTWADEGFQVTKLQKTEKGDWLCVSASGDAPKDGAVAYEQVYLSFDRILRLLAE